MKSISCWAALPVWVFMSMVSKMSGDGDEAYSSASVRYQRAKPARTCHMTRWFITAIIDANGDCNDP